MFSTAGKSSHFSIIKDRDNLEFDLSVVNEWLKLGFRRAIVPGTGVESNTYFVYLCRPHLSDLKLVMTSTNHALCHKATERLANYTATLGAGTWQKPVIRRFELASTLVAWRLGNGCPALHHLRRHGRTNSTLLSSVVWNRMTVCWVARLIAVTIAQKEEAAIGRLL